MFNLFKKKYTNKRELEIDLFFKYVNWYKLLVQQWGLYPSFNAASDAILRLKEYKERLRKDWKKNPNFTLAEMLSGSGYFPRFLPSRSEWFFDDIPTILQKMGIREGDYTIWASAYNMFGRKRKQIIFKAVSEMSTWHIKRVMKSQYLRISHRNARVFQNELTKRGVKLW